MIYLMMLITFSFAAPAPDLMNTLPLNCSELMPEITPYLNYFESVGSYMGSKVEDRRYAKRIFKILYLRNKAQIQSDKVKSENQVDALIRKSLCFYREKTEPLKPVAIDDPQFLSYLRKNLGELERKVDEAIYQVEFERIRKETYEKRLQKNWGAIERLKQEAVIEGNQSLSKITSKASRNVKIE